MQERSNRLSVALLGFLIVWIAWGAPTRSGSGKIYTQGTKEGQIDFTAKFLYPPTQQEIDHLIAEITAASEDLCDASEGQVRFGTVTISGGTLVGLDDADMVIRPEDGRSYASLCGADICDPDDCDQINCSSLDKPGKRITLFHDGIDGHVIAHEFGHYAFDLGDEYDEQPKGIGKCLECDTVSQTNTCLMQEYECGVVAEDATELCHAGNHDLVQGDPLLPDCADPDDLDCAPPNPDLCQYWNADTCSYELTMQSAWSFTKFGQINDCWNHLNMVYPFLEVEPVDPTPAGFCSTVPEFVVDVQPIDQVVLVLDRSWSMNFLPGVGQCNGGPDCPEICDTGYDEDDDGVEDEADCVEGNRIEFLKQSSRTFLNMLKGGNFGNPIKGDAGIVSFDCSVTPDADVIPVGWTNYDNILAPAIDDLQPGGNTAIGDALAAAVDHFPESEGNPNRDVLLITDGWHNCGETEVEEAIDILGEAGIGLYVITVGSAANPGLPTLGPGTQSTGGQLIALEDERALVPAMMQQWSAYSHAGLIIPKLRYELNAFGTFEDSAHRRNAQSWVDGQDSPVVGGTGAPVLHQNRFEFHVEEGTEMVALSLAGDMQNMKGFGVRAILDGPAGPHPSHFDTDAVVPGPHFEVDANEYFDLLRLHDPNPGDWTIELRVPAAPGIEPIQTGHLTIVAQNPRASLSTILDRHLVSDSTNPVRLGIEAGFGTALSGADLQAVVRRPDGTFVPLTVDDHTYFDAGYSARFGAMTQQGLYEIRVLMTAVPGQTTNHPGESLHEDSPPNDFPVPTVIRSSVEYFWVENGAKVCPSGTTLDCDGDGVLNESRSADLDGDGVPDDCDPDSDGDGIPDDVDCLTPGIPYSDHDGDGTPGCQDPDADGDGVNDADDPGIDVSQPHHRLDLVDIDVDVCGNVRTTNVLLGSDEPVSEMTVGLVWSPTSMLDVLSIRAGIDIPPGSVQSLVRFIGPAGGLAPGEALVQLTLNTPLDPGINRRVLEIETRAGAGALPGRSADLCLAPHLGTPPQPTELTVDRPTGPASVIPDTTCGVARLQGDSTPPGLYCPADAVLRLDATCKAVWSDAGAAEDSCDPSPELSASPELPIGYSGVGTDEVLYTATDLAGNVTQCETTIDIVDDTAPLGGIVFPQGGQCLGTPVTLADDLSDNCDTASLSRTYDPPGPTYGHGHWDIEMVALDLSGNAAVDRVLFDVDLVPPTVEVTPQTLSVPSVVDATDLFRASDDDRAGGGPVREQLLFDGCVVFDGIDTGDGLISDEVLTLDVTTLCEAAARCGLPGFDEVNVEAVVLDCAGNEGRAAGTMQLDPPLTLDACDPALQVDVDSVRWTPVFAATSYDVVRGDLGTPSLDAVLNDLGGVVCLADDAESQAVSDATVPPSREGFFFLVRYQHGETVSGYGTSSSGLDRQPGTGDCPL